MRNHRFPHLATFAVSLGVLSCAQAGPPGPPVEVTIPSGATFQEVLDTLQVRGLVKRPGVFQLFARLKGSDRQVKAGQYSFPADVSWSRLLDDLTRGRVLTESLTIPEGFTLQLMAPRIAAITETDPDSVSLELTRDSAAADWNLPGPTLEGYLFPDTYRFALGSSLQDITGAMVARYREFWTPSRVEARDSLGLTEKELVTLASIVQSEARLEDEMPLIASVYHNRLERGIALQADPTVLYALGGPRPRLLYAAMDSVADHPYNTYTHAGLPPGPIGAPGTAALEASLHPADTDYLYFVAHPDGYHIFSSTLAEHNQAVARVRVEWDRFRQESRASSGG